ncbi:MULTISPECIES: glycosyltransferase [Sphingobium]|uniref:glycosyltransferase n=1 Tax=Sphingobium TaxID=165695 RepID=UPI0015EBA4A3|nr:MULTISPECIES: glycosyltransferase [Sphingobium]MCW2361378.1 glycosyltransferase involved in cell wall biosynthesis/GT2 family glycosyltransferase [Sphingobium sp. B10D3B]MCW2401943.1 glycosyltransferase involved in cell wall biosynthesis/GT2 family glycosyltransferase [Sphingobium sp. B10D7B]MCW2408922.1 glycosyltransferase involved in cell wall biosynthesis/GT2 family glycosyltransferase [Sphingobium xanthum]
MANVSSSKWLLGSPNLKIPLTFSVVINTDNRLDYLKRTLSGLKYLKYQNFEVCIVSGPTPDGTKEYLSTLGDAIKLAHCPVRNLSVSRNIGIAMAGGDVVAFIDDDSVPEPEWLSDLAVGYKDEGVGAVGGFVYDNTGVQFQARYVTTNRRGYATDWATPAPHLNFPYSVDVPHLLGTNCSFRRSALLEIGGFDEEYEYFLDETDVCCRINDAGYRIVQLPNGFVHHKYAPSHLRDERRVTWNWYPLIKNRVYFGMRNGLNHHSVSEVVEAGIADADAWERSVLWAQREGIYQPEHIERFYAEATSAVQDGLTRGREPPKYLTEETISKFHSSYRSYPLISRPEERRVFCFVTQDYPPGQNGGIARYISQLARSLAARGHHVHVLTKAHQHESVDYEDGVWVHRVKIRHFAEPEQSPIAPLKVPSHIWSYTQTMFEEVVAIDAKRKVDMVYCPLWDCEPLSFILDTRFPLVVALQTTMKFWLESQKARARDRDWMHVFGKPIIAMENLILKAAPSLHAISNAIAQDIQTEYEIQLDASRVHFVPLGMEDWAGSNTLDSKTGAAKSEVHLLFVGRLESRKGIDVLLAAVPDLLERFPNAILDIVGDDTILRADNRSYKEEFLETDIPSAVRERIVFHGRVAEAELQNFYRSCDVFVAPSRYESFGLVFLEAMMFGKPVIACDAGGGPEVVTHEHTGYLVKPGDIAGLKKAMETLVADPALRRKMGQIARSRYEERFTDEAMVNNFLAEFLPAI